MYLQAWQRSFSARLPQVLKLTISKNVAILWDLLSVWTWQRQKQRKSARLSFKNEMLHLTQHHLSKPEDLCFAPQRRALFEHLNFQKCSENGVLCTFWLYMCFAPQRHALFQHRNFQKCSDVGAFCTFWLRNVLRAAMACNLSSLIPPDGSAPAALASLLFDPPEPQVIGKTQWIATLLPFLPPASSFFWLFLFPDLLLSTFYFLLSSSSSSSSLLWFHPPVLFSCPYCRKFDF